jgi:hypothetical protein
LRVTRRNSLILLVLSFLNLFVSVLAYILPRIYVISGAAIGLKTRGVTQCWFEASPVEEATLKLVVVAMRL